MKKLNYILVDVEFYKLQGCSAIEKKFLKNGYIIFKSTRTGLYWFYNPNSKHFMPIDNVEGDSLDKEVIAFDLYCLKLKLKGLKML